MESLYDLYTSLPREQWYYYEEHSENEFTNPFTSGKDWELFIKQYFNRAGKGEIFDDAGIELKNIRYPEHICSVHFLGILLYNQTDLKTKFDLGKNEGVGYEFFPFLWFLIALFHDNFYAIERSEDPKLRKLSGLYDEYKIDKKLLNCTSPNLPRMAKLREDYYKYRGSKERADHGIAAGIVLYDKLLKIREANENVHPKRFYWGKKLIPKYQMAADAISLHNIWLPQDGLAEKEYPEFDLNSLIDFDPVKKDEFPLFYLMGIVDTLEPLKAYSCVKDKKYVLQNLLIQIDEKSFTIKNQVDSMLDFGVMKKKAKNLDKWLDVKVDLDEDNSLTIFFNRG